MTSQNSETLTCWYEYQFCFSRVWTEKWKNQGAYFIRFLQAEKWSLLLFSCSVVSNSLQPHRLQHAGLCCPSPSTRACSNSCPLGRWCHPQISSSVVPFFFCPQSLRLTLLDGRVHGSLWAPWLKFFAGIFLCIFSSATFPSYNS